MKVSPTLSSETAFHVRSE